MQTPSPAPHFIRMIIHESDQNNDSPRLQSREFFQKHPKKNTNQSTNRYHKIDEKDMDLSVAWRILKLRQDFILPLSIPEIRPQTNYHAKNNRSPFAKVSPKNVYVQQDTPASKGIPGKWRQKKKGQRLRKTHPHPSSYRKSIVCKKDSQKDAS